MRPALLLIVTSPLAALWWADYATRTLVWYTLSALLLAFGLVVAALLLTKSSATRLALLTGAAVQIVAAGCGVVVDGGTCDKPSAIPWIAISILAAVSFLAELIHTMEVREWRRKTTHTASQ